MKQFSYVVRSHDEFADMLQDAGWKMAKMSVISSVFISVFCTKKDRNFLEELVRKLHEFLPDAGIIGGLVALCVADEIVAEGGTSVSFHVFSSTEAEVVSFHSRSLNSGEIGQAIKACLQGHSDVKAAGMFMVDNSLDTGAILAAMEGIDPKIRFFGGIVDEDYLGQQGCIFTEKDAMTSGVAVVILQGEELHVETMECFGWEPLGRDMIITGLDGSSVVREIDHAPAIASYEKYLGIRDNDEFAWEAATFPIYFERGNRVLARYPRSCRSDGAVVFSADFQQGDHLHFAYGDPEGIIDKARGMRQQMRLFQPEGILLASCAARWMLLANDISLELDSCRGIAPFSGFYGFGEFHGNGGDIVVSNMCLQLVGMREGEPAGELADPLPPHVMHFSWQTHIMQHMVHFIRTSTQELEAVNQGLAELAQTDRLTALLNRGELEAVMVRSLELAKEAGQPLSVIMMDIDDFKGINDNYGHDTGDQALKLVADVLRENTRRMDAPGRWGGDEFFIILMGIGVEAAAKIAERVRQGVSKVTFLPDGKHITTSLGVTEAKKEDDALSLFRRADQALYKAKKENGKDNVSIVD